MLDRLCKAVVCKFTEAATQAEIAQYQPQGTQVKILNVVDLAMPIPTSYAAG